MLTLEGRRDLRPHMLRHTIDIVEIAEQRHGIMCFDYNFASKFDFVLTAFISKYSIRISLFIVLAHVPISSQ